MIIGIAIVFIGLGLVLSDPKPRRGLIDWIAELVLITGLAMVGGWISVMVLPLTN